VKESLRRIAILPKTGRVVIFKPLDETWTSMKLQTRFIPFLALAILALLFAMWAGLLRLGWALPTLPTLALAHGPLMISGFLGVLIPLERAVAINSPRNEYAGLPLRSRKWMFAAPLACGAWLGQPAVRARISAAILMTVGSVVALFHPGRDGAARARHPHLHHGGRHGGVGTRQSSYGSLDFPIYQLVALVDLLPDPDDRRRTARTQPRPASRARADSRLRRSRPRPPRRGRSSPLFNANWWRAPQRVRHAGAVAMVPQETTSPRETSVTPSR
jgi:hypothetical protein